MELAGRLGVDRTTMVALIDGLERKGLVERRRSARDRRRNVVLLTAEGNGAAVRRTRHGCGSNASSWPLWTRRPPRC